MTVTPSPYLKDPESRSLLQPLSRFQLPGNLSSPLPLEPISIHLLPGGQWLVAVASMNACDEGGPDSTGVSLWDLQDIATPRCVVDFHLKEGSSSDLQATVAELDKDRGIVRLLFGYSSTQDSSEPRNMLEAYDIPLENRLARPEAYQVSVPGHPSQGQDSDIRDVAISGDILSCIVRDTSQLDAFLNNPDGQLKPLVPPAGVEQVYLIHRPTNTGRWLRPHHTSSLRLSVYVLLTDTCLYLLGRTPTTYILRSYCFSPNMLIDCPEDAFLDLGQPLAEYESPPLPDPGIPWGSWDFQDVRLEPSSHLSVLMLRSWYGEGQYLLFPLHSGGQPSTHSAPAPKVVRLEPDTHLPSNAHFYPRWLGRDQAIIFSDDDDFSDKNLLVRLSFSHSDFEIVSSGQISSAGSVRRESGRVLREDLLTAESPLAKETRILTRPCALSVDEESGRMCVLLMNGEGLILSAG